MLCYYVSAPHCSDYSDHIDHLKLVAGIDHVGIGSDFDGTEKYVSKFILSMYHLILCDVRVPKGLEDVSKYPSLFAELIRRGYSDSDIAKIARDNFLRVFKAVEEVIHI